MRTECSLWSLAGRIHRPARPLQDEDSAALFACEKQELVRLVIALQID